MEELGGAISCTATLDLSTLRLGECPKDFGKGYERMMEGIDENTCYQHA